MSGNTVTEATSSQPDAGHVPTIMVCDRVEFVRRFVQVYWPDGAWSGSLPTPLSWENLPNVITELARPRAAGNSLLDDEAVVELCLQRFSTESSAAADRTTHQSRREGFRSHLRRRMVRLRTESLTSSELTAGLLCAGHNLAAVVCHRRHSTSDVASARSAAGELCARLRSNPQRFRLSSQAGLALWMTDFLMQRHPLFRSGLGPSAASTPGALDPFERELLDELLTIAPNASRDLTVMGGSAGDHDAAGDGAGLWSRVREQSLLLREWSQWVFPVHQSRPSSRLPARVYTESGHGTAWSNGWKNRVSAARGSDNTFERQMKHGCDTVTELLFALCRSPLPTALAAIFESLRQQIPAGRPLNPCVSAALRRLVQVLYHALVPVLCERVGTVPQDTSGRLGQQLTAALAKLSDIVLAPGDLHAIWLLLEGIRDHLGDSPNWQNLREQHPNSAAAISQIVALCPPAWLMTIELGPSCTDNEPGRNALRLFLETPSLKMLRSDVVQEWRRRLLSGDHNALVSTRQAMDVCVEAETLAGSVFAAEAIRALLEAVIGPVFREFETTVPTARIDTAAVHAETSSDWIQVHRWLDHGPHREWLCHMVMKLVEARRCISRSRNTLHADRFRRHWQRISVLSTCGLWRRRWPDEPLQLLQLFWLDVCRLVIDRSTCLPPWLDTGEPATDQLDRLACDLFGQLVKREVQKLEVRGLEYDRQVKLNVCDLPAEVRNLLMKHGPLQKLLQVHGLLLNGDGAFVWHVNMDALYPPQSVWSVSPVLIYETPDFLPEPPAG